jgi:hypothetical protein
MNSPETLLEHATWLRRLAASLVGDPASADDLVQDTWVAAITVSGRNVVPWRLSRAGTVNGTVAIHRLLARSEPT